MVVEVRLLRFDQFGVLGKKNIYDEACPDDRALIRHITSRWVATSEPGTGRERHGDRTREVLAQQGSKVFEFSWNVSIGGWYRRPNSSPNSASIEILASAVCPAVCWSWSPGHTRSLNSPMPCFEAQ